MRGAHWTSRPHIKPSTLYPKPLTLNLKSNVLKSSPRTHQQVPCHAGEQRVALAGRRIEHRQQRALVHLDGHRLPVLRGGRSIRSQSSLKKNLLVPLKHRQLRTCEHVVCRCCRVGATSHCVAAMHTLVAQIMCVTGRLEASRTGPSSNQLEVEVDS